MQRVRMSLPYFKNFGWDAEVVTVDPEYSDITKDELLLQSIPDDIKIHRVKAFSKKWTSKFGVGSIALRSMLFYKRRVNRILSERKFDLIYFSTTQFPICVLGKYWKQKFDIPYVIDMQDPWHSEYYKDKPKHEQPRKYWFSYRLNKYLEPIAMRHVDGLISVTEKYIIDLKERYTEIKNIPSDTITFGAFLPDFQIAGKNNIKSYAEKNDGKISIAYVGVVGPIMKRSLKILFTCLNKLKTDDFSLYQAFEWFFVGTSYAPQGTGKETVMPIAKEFEVSEKVREQTDRVTYFEALKTITSADGLLIIGSDDPNYTASKTYPYIVAQKPLFAILHSNSSAVNIITDCNAGDVIGLDDALDMVYIKFKRFLDKCFQKQKPQIAWNAFEPHLAKNMTQQQCGLFEKVVRCENPIEQI